MRARALDLSARFRRHLLGSDQLEAGDGLVVALSGGLDSTTLLHLLRFTPGLPQLDLYAAHVDHRMREGSGADRSWVTGLARSWHVPLRVHSATTPPASEDEARRLRYDFLEAVRRATDARWVLTAHHADDQVETVLFRIMRGTGTRGLAGIPQFRAPGLWRPLLPFRRKELEAYAAAVGLRWRDDATNADEGYARNVLRNRVLPLLEQRVSPGVRDAIDRLARLARLEEDAWESLTPHLLGSLALERTPGRVSFDRGALLSYHEGVRARLLRTLAHRAGSDLDAAGTRIAVAFTSSGESGKGVRLTGAMELSREFDRFVLAAARRPSAASGALTIEGDRGSGEVRLAGSCFQVRWAPSGVGGTWKEAFDGEAMAWPLTVRSWIPGDRIRLSYGSKKLKKLFLESRIPVSRRGRIPVLADSGGRVLWIPGVVRSVLAQPAESHQVLEIGVSDANPD